MTKQQAGSRAKLLERLHRAGVRTQRNLSTEETGGQTAKQTTAARRGTLYYIRLPTASLEHGGGCKPFIERKRAHCEPAWHAAQLKLECNIILRLYRQRQTGGNPRTTDNSQSIKGTSRARLVRTTASQHTWACQPLCTRRNATPACTHGVLPDY